MLRVGLLVMLVGAVSIGCRKKADDSPGGSPPASSPQVSEASSQASDWGIVGDVAVRIEKVRVQKPVVEERENLTSSNWKDRELEEPELNVWVRIENRTKVRKLDYRGWDAIGRKADPVATDEHGNKYTARTHEKVTRRPKGYAKRGAINPGDQAVSDVLFFERPVSAATKLLVTLPALAEWQNEPYQFEIPASAWTGAGNAVPIAYKKPTVEPKREEKFAGVNEWVTADESRVRITKAKLDNVPIIHKDTLVHSKKPELMVWFEIENLSKTKKLDYFRWGSLGSDDSVIKDEHGNNYRISPYDQLAARVEGAQRYSTIELRPGDPAIVDILCIEPPVDAAKEMFLTLSAIKIGSGEKHRFKIPASAWKK